MFYEHVERTAASVQLQLTGRVTNTPLSIFLPPRITKRYECSFFLSLYIHLHRVTNAFSFSLSLSLCVRACVRSSREWKRPRIKFRPRRKVGRACAGRRNCTFASLNNHTSPSNNRPTREISPDLCARAFNLSLSLSRSNRFSGIRDKITGKMGEEMEEEER